MGLDTIKQYFIGIILFVIVITGGIFIIGSFLGSDPSIDPVNDVGKFSVNMSKASEITASVNAIDASVSTAANTSAGPLGWIDAAFSSAINGMTAIGQSVSFMDSTLTAGATTFGIPGFVMPLLYLVIVVIIVFAIWAAITRSP